VATLRTTELALLFAEEYVHFAECLTRWKQETVYVRVCEYRAQIIIIIIVVIIVAAGLVVFPFWKHFIT